MASSSYLASRALAHREVVRFLRQRNRVTGALAQPVLFWAIFGAGLSPSFRTGAIGYSEYFFPGVIVMILLFTAIFATISIIDDRNTGFLQGVLVAPVPRSAIILGKVVGTTVLAVGQALLVSLAAPLFGMSISFAGILLSIPVLVLLSIALAGLGVWIAWRMDSTQGFHAIMTSFLFPMWLLSGAFFPPGGTPKWLAIVIAINPLTYGVALLRHALYLGSPMATAGLPSLTVCIVVTTLFAVATIAGASSAAKARTGGAHP
ncbi:MAG TPA: ABC transporter permease [Candidatus Limnocylindrales bacterium]|nr:ABC transporter permease [Candidatus Limnocylindrales bacterium]